MNTLFAYFSVLSLRPKRNYSGDGVQRQPLYTSSWALVIGRGLYFVNTLFDYFSVLSLRPKTK